MSRDLADLTDEFRPLAEKLIQQCALAGVTMRPITTLRAPDEQARLWRSSRAKEQIDAALVLLRDAHADYLADVLEGVGPQEGKAEVTKALPGLSWHQHGEAIDCMRVINGAAAWDGISYDEYDRQAAALGLTTLSFERVHAQMRKQGSPQDLWSLAEIDAKMKARFGVFTPTS